MGAATNVTLGPPPWDMRMRSHAERSIVKEET